jgi:undecaprenyl-diphosphatase
MKSDFHRFLTMFIKLKCFIAGLLILSSIQVSGQNWDINITKSINPDDPNSAFWKGVTNSVNYFAVAMPVTQFAVGVINKNPTVKRQAYLTAGSIAIESIVTQVLKYSINRPRPAETYPTEIFPYKDLHGKSMPSGHTALAFALATSAALEYKKWYIAVPAYLWAGAVGYSRMYLGAHYFSDVMTGAAIGVGSAFLSRYLVKIIFKEKKFTSQTQQSQAWRLSL